MSTKLTESPLESPPLKFALLNMELHHVDSDQRHALVTPPLNADSSLPSSGGGAAKSISLLRRKFWKLTDYELERETPGYRYMNAKIVGHPLVTYVEDLYISMYYFKR